MVVSAEAMDALATVCPERYATNSALRAIWLMLWPACSPSWCRLRRNRFAFAVVDVGMCVSMVPANCAKVATHCSNGMAWGWGSCPGIIGAVMVASSPGRLMTDWVPLLAGHSSARASARKARLGKSPSWNARSSRPRC